MSLKIKQIENSETLKNNEIPDIRNTDDDCALCVGDNLPVLDRLSIQFSGSINFCYIDPPYNTGNKFIYDDRRYSSNDSVWGTHLAWMDFMRPRLELARTLLADDGIIAVSIDDYEQPYLRILLDQIFGETNFISCITTCRSNNGKGARGNIATNHEYIVVYSKSKSAKVRGLPDVDLESYNKFDEHGEYRIDGLFRKKGDASLRTDRPNMFYPLYFDELGRVYTENSIPGLKEVYPVDSQGIERRWLWGKEKATAESWKLYSSPNGVVYVKNYFDRSKRIKPKSLWVDNRYLTEKATNQIKEIFGSKVFETPKPVELLEDLIDSHTSENALILDFFAGTGTTAHAAFNLNKKDNGNRKTILVEQDASIDPSHVAYENGFRVISDITQARLDWLVKHHRLKYLKV